MPSKKQFKPAFPIKKSVRLLKDLAKATHLGESIEFDMTLDVEDSLKAAVKVARAVNPDADLRMPKTRNLSVEAEEFWENHRVAARRAAEFEDYLGGLWIQAEQLLDLLTSPVISEDHKCGITDVANGWLVSVSLEIERLLDCWRKLEAGEKDLPL